jgi:hypothetical protein
LIFSLTFYPGTGLYDKAREDGLIKDDEKDVYEKFIYDTNNSYFNSLFYLFLFLKNLCVPAGFSRKLLEPKIINAVLFKPFKFIIARSTGVLKGFYLCRFVVHAMKSGDINMLKNYMTLALSKLRGAR